MTLHWSTPQRRHRPTSCSVRDRGSAAIEAAVGVPALILFIGLIIAAGRVAIAYQAVESAASDAARSASIARTQADAKADATSAAVRSLNEQQVNCVNTRADIDTSGFAAPVGTPAQVAATVTCQVNLTTLLPFLPGSREISQTMTSPVDTYRER